MVMTENMRVALGWKYYKDSGSAPAAPAPVDPSVQVQAQARATPSSYGPYGSVIYSGDPNVSGSFRADTTLSPEQQALYQSKTGIAQSLLDRSGHALSSLPGTFQGVSAADPNTNAFWGQQKKLLDVAFGQSEDRERQRLANQGIPEGSPAFTAAMNDFQRQKNDAYTAASTGALQTGQGMALSTRQQQMNELAQALGGQVTNPGGAGNPTDVASAYANQQAALNRQYQGQLAGYNADVAGNNATMGTIGTIGAGVAMAF